MTASLPQLRRRRRRHPGRVIVFLLVAVVTFAVAFGDGLLSAPIDFTVPPPPSSALLLDSHGRLFATIRSPEAREDVAAADIPLVMREAIVAAEDERFLSHGGVDPLAIVRAAVRDITGTGSQGGSTITQQYVKNVYTGSERTLFRKLREAALAIRLEQRLTKDEILTRYLNGLYLGNGAYGVQAASKFYFGVPVKSVTLAQASMLAGIAPAPSVYNPVHDLRKARERQRYTLNRMVANHMITPQQASDAFRVVPRIVKRHVAEVASVAPEFADLVEQRLRRDYGEEALFRGDLRVTTTLDLDLQQAARAALGDVLTSAKDPEAAVVAIDPRNGDIKAMATKRDGGYKRGQSLNLATDIARNSGSTIKPFTLIAALENGFSVDDGRYAPTRKDVHVKGFETFHVKNAGDSESGFFTLRTGLWYSVNTLYAPLAADVGLRKVRAVAKAAGMGPEDPHNLWVYPAMALGVPVSPLAEARAYATIAARGVRRDPRSLLEVRAGAVGKARGSLVYKADPSPKGTRVIPVGIADQVIDVLKGVVQRGTGTAARQSFDVFGKTGTTENFIDAWFTGCTQDLCIAVWMGYDKQYVAGHCKGGVCPHSMLGVEGVPEVFGGTLPAQIFARTWKHYLEATNPTPTPSPAVRFQPRPSKSRRPSTSPTPTVPPSTKPTATASRTPPPSATPTGPPVPLPTATSTAPP